MTLSLSSTAECKQPYTEWMRRSAPMLKAAPKARKRRVRVVKGAAKRVDIRETYRDTMKRYPKTMALLAD